MAGERASEPLLATEFSERNGELSPDRRWMAYQSNASGEYQIYVRPFPNVDEGRWQISTGGGTRPLWSPDGRELFYVASGGQLMAVSVQTDPTFAVGNAEVALEGLYFAPSGGFPGRTYDISPDGQRFLMIKEGAPRDLTNDPFAGLIRIEVVLNWHQELLERVPVQ